RRRLPAWHSPLIFVLWVLEPFPYADHIPWFKNRKQHEEDACVRIRGWRMDCLLYMYVRRTMQALFSLLAKAKACLVLAIMRCPAVGFFLGMVTSSFGK